MYPEKILTVSRGSIGTESFCTAGKFQRILLHVVRTSSEKSAIIAILGGDNLFANQRIYS